MKNNNFLLIIFIYLFNLNNSFAMQADIFVQSTVNRASTILASNNSKEKKIEKLKSIAKETVDINGIGLYTLGSIRKTLNEEQLSEYKNLFKTGS